jgi:hypothetical protein
LFEPWTVFGAALPSVAVVTLLQCALPLIVFPASSTSVESLIVTERPTRFDSISTLCKFVTVTEPVNVFPGQSKLAVATSRSPPAHRRFADPEGMPQSAARAFWGHLLLLPCHRFIALSPVAQPDPEVLAAVHQR